MPRNPRWIVLRALLLAVLLVSGVLVALIYGVPSVPVVRARIAAAGAAAPIVFLLIYAVATLAPLPKNVLSAAAGLLFGLSVGVILVWAGAMLGALMAFALGRALGRQAVEQFTGARVARIDAALTRRGLISVIAVRLTPLLPFTAINYAAGLTSLRTGTYLLGTGLGIVPGTVAYVAVGTYSTSIGSWPFVVAVVLLVALSLIGVWVSRRKNFGPAVSNPGRRCDITARPGEPPGPPKGTEGP